VQRHLYAHSAHGFAMTLPGGWEAFLWQRDARKIALVCASRFPRFEPLARFVASPTLEGYTVLVETEDESLDDELTAAGYEPEYLLPGHFIPTSIEFCNQLVRTMPMPPLPFKLVTNPETLADFAYVQDHAYRDTYDWPKGCASLFYTDPGSLIGPDSIGAVLYDSTGLPCRTASLIHKRGIVAGVAGAATPRVRGQHRGEQLMFLLLLLARQVWGAEYVHHITMPCAAPIAKRLGLEHVTTYYRWRKP
jgi:hypothetical protein